MALSRQEVLGQVNEGLQASGTSSIKDGPYSVGVRTEGLRVCTACSRASISVVLGREGICSVLGDQCRLHCNPAMFQITMDSEFRSEPPRQPATLSRIFSEQAMSRDCTQGCEVGHQEFTVGRYLDGRDFMWKRTYLTACFSSQPPGAASGLAHRLLDDEIMQLL